MSENNLIYKIWSSLNRKSFAKSYKLFTIGIKTSELLAQYIDQSEIIVSPNWSLFSEGEKVHVTNNNFISAHNLEGKFVVQYSGNIGLTHNVEFLIDLAAKLKSNDKIIFQNECKNNFL